MASIRTGHQAARGPGMGAVPDASGCTFRLWAPFAQEVYVTGAFAGAPADWSQGLVPLQSDGATWSGWVSGARDGNPYRYVVVPPGGSLAADASLLWRMDPYGRDATAAEGNSLICVDDFQWPTSSFQMPGWNQLVIYELHVGTFNRSTPTTVGTFADIIGKLDYLADLGINAIEVMPAADFDTDTSMGYNTSLPFALDSAYGKPNALKEFIAEAHARGIAVFMDVVYNHFGPFGLDACLRRLDGWFLPGKSGIYFYADDRSGTAYGADNRPDFGRPEVRQFIRDNATMWLHEYRIDGLRVDSTVNMRRAILGDGRNLGDIPDGWGLLKWLTNEKNREQPWKVMIAEDLQNEDAITRSTTGGGAGFDAQWDATFRQRVLDLVSAVADEQRDVGALAAALGKSYNGQGLFQRVVYAESHDEAASRRLPARIVPNDPEGWFARKRSALALGLTLTAPGIPMIFQGAEFLDAAPWSDQRGLDWSRLSRFGGFHDLVRELIRLRRDWYDNTAGLRGGNVNVFYWSGADHVIAFHRWDVGGVGDDVVVVANCGNRRFDSYRIGFPRPGRWWLRCNTDDGRWCSDFTSCGYTTTADTFPLHGLPCSGNVGLGPYSLAVYSQ